MTSPPNTEQARRGILTMDSAHFTGMAVFAGSVVGALISFISTWLTMSRESRAKRVSENKSGRQKLYAQFIEETSKLYMDALVRDQAEGSAMVSVYALLSKIRMASNGAVVEAAEAVIRTIITTYSRPNKTFPELQDLMLNRGFVDPLLSFSEVCRDELHDVSSRQSIFPGAPHVRAAITRF